MDSGQPLRGFPNGTTGFARVGASPDLVPERHALARVNGTASSPRILPSTAAVHISTDYFDIVALRYRIRRAAP